MGSLSIWHWIVVIAIVLLLFGRGKISDLMGDVAQGIKAFKKGMQDDDKTAEKSEPVRSIDHTNSPTAAAPSDGEAAERPQPRRATTAHRVQLTAREAPKRSTKPADRHSRSST